MRHLALLPGISRSLDIATHLLALLAMTGCVVTSSDVYLAREFADNRFTYESLQSQGIGVLGVTSVDFDVPGTSATTDWLGPRFVSEIERERSDLTLTSPTEIAAALGDEPYVEVLDTHSEYAALDSATVGDLAADLTGFRYLAVAYIDSDVVEYSHSLSEQDEVDTSCTVFSVHMRARAVVKVRFQVYDLVTGHQVWVGECRSMKDSKTTKYAGRRCNDIGDALVQSLLNAILGLEDDDEVFVEYLDPPKFFDVLCPCFRRFAQRLPVATGRH